MTASAFARALVIGVAGNDASPSYPLAEDAGTRELVAADGQPLPQQVALTERACMMTKGSGYPDEEVVDLRVVGLPGHGPVLSQARD